MDLHCESQIVSPSTIELVVLKPRTADTAGARQAWLEAYVSDAMRITRRRWTSGEEDALREYHGTMTAAQIGTILGRTPGAIWNRAMKLGITLHAGATYQPYFRQVDSPVKAYVLGLLAADGYVDDAGRIGIDLVVGDQSAVALVRDELRPTGRVRVYPRKDGQPRARFQVGSVGMARDLAVLGIGPRKTRTLAWPQALPTEFDNSFICGYFDGDGHVRTTPGLYWTVCSATSEFLDVMRERIEAGTGVHTSRTYRQSSIWAISKYGEPVRALDAWMHRDVPGLPRKRLRSPDQDMVT